MMPDEKQVEFAISLEDRLLKPFRDTIVELKCDIERGIHMLNMPSPKKDGIYLYINTFLHPEDRHVMLTSSEDMSIGLEGSRIDIDILMQYSKTYMDLVGSFIVSYEMK